MNKKRMGILAQLLLKKRKHYLFVNNILHNLWNTLRLVKEYSKITELTDEIVATFIERVEVFEPLIVDGEKKQRIQFVYNFIGEFA